MNLKQLYKESNWKRRKRSFRNYHSFRIKFQTTSAKRSRREKGERYARRGQRKKEKKKRVGVVTFYGTSEWNTWLSSLPPSLSLSPCYRSSSYYPKLHWHPSEDPGGPSKKGHPCTSSGSLNTTKYLYIQLVYNQVSAHRSRCGKPRRMGNREKWIDRICQLNF